MSRPVGRKIGEMRAETGATWEVHASLAGVTMAGGAPISPSDASALARLLLDAAEASRVMRLRAEPHATMLEVERGVLHGEAPEPRPRLVPDRPKVTCVEHGLVRRPDGTSGAGCRGLG